MSVGGGVQVSAAMKKMYNTLNLFAVTTRTFAGSVFLTSRDAPPTFCSLLFAHAAMAEAARLLNTFFIDYDCNALRLYLQKNYDSCVKQAEVSHSSLLHYVALLHCTDCDKASMVQTLVRRGVMVDGRDDNGMTPLINC
jgi:hypothetical protein